jgi:hypothetical protein
LTIKTNTIIGGLFGLEYEENPKKVTPSFISGRDLFLVNARSGIWLLVNRLRPPQVWVPSYLCHTILGAITPDETVLRFYEVDYDLKIRSGQWISEINSGDLVIFIDYFGFPYDHQIGVSVKEKGAWVLEDACQALLSSHVGGSSDFVLFSLRKWIGVPDGGILRFPESIPINGISLDTPTASWWLKALQASILRREFDEGLPTREWFKLFRQVEDTAPTGLYAMSQLSKAISECSVDYSIVARRRRDNYFKLLEKLTEYAAFPQIDPDVVPLGFPVRLAKRDAVRQALFDHQIYPPVHWLIEGIIPPEYEDSHRLASEIMTLPCDQRYGPEDMERMAEVCLESSTQHE